MPSSDQSEKSRTNEIHFVLQGKGGVGKSLVATLLAEYLSERIATLRCFDTDPVNPTFSTYSAFNVTQVNLFNDNEIVTKNFDSMMIPLLEPGVSGIIDNGATTFIHLMNYIDRVGIFEMLLNAGKTVFIHTIVAGGDALGETGDGFNQIMSNLVPGVNVIVWLNELHGPVERGGLAFTESPVFKKYEQNVVGVVVLPKPWGDMFAQDLQALRQVRLTLGEAIAGKDNPATGEPFNIMERQRFTMVRRDFFQKMRTASI